MKLHISQNDPDINKRLDLYLTLKIPSHSRSQIKKIIESNQVSVNKSICYKAGYKVQENDEIEFPDIEPEDSKFTKLPKSKFSKDIL